MKRYKKFMSIAALALAFVLPASAQQFAQQYETTPSSERDAAWWYQLEREVNVEPGVSAANVKAEALQEIVYVARRYQGRVDLRASVPLLLDVYQNHPAKGYRILALAALDAIQDPYGMEGLRDAIKGEPSEHLRRMTRVALRNYDEAQSVAEAGANRP